MKIQYLAKCKEHLGRAATTSRFFRTPVTEEGIRCLHRGSFDEALQILRDQYQEMPKVVDLSFHDAFYLNYLYGEDGRDPRRIQAYIDRLERLVKVHDDFPDIRNMLGIAYLIQCRHLYSRSLHEFQEAVDLNPEFRNAVKNLKLTKNDARGLLILLRALLK